MTEQQRCEAQYQLLFEASPAPSWLIDPETGRFLLVNDAALRLYGYTRDEFLGMTIEDLRLPKDAGPPTQNARAPSSGSLVVSGADHHRRKDGSVFVVQLTANETQLAGRPALLTWVCDPERQGACAALTGGERRLADAQALAHVGSWEWDLSAERATWSSELYRIFGVQPGSQSDFHGFMQCVHPDDRERVARLDADARAQRLPSFDYECRILRPSGEIRYILHRNVVTFDADGTPVRMAGTALDITEQRRIEQALADSEQLHRELVEYSWDIVTMMSTEGVVQYMSPAGLRLLGRTPSDVLGRNLLEFIHPDDAPLVLEGLKHAVSEPANPNVVTIRFRHQDGTWRWLESIGKARERPPGVYTIVVNARDVSDRKIAEGWQQTLMADLRAAQLVAEAATRAKSAFLANMSHEIRTPMNAVLGLTELLLDSGLTAEQRRQLEMVRDSGSVLLTLLNDILDLSKIEADHVELEAIPLDLAGLVQSTANLFAAAARERDLELLVDFGPDVPPCVNGDPTRLRQILGNLLGNAIKFTHQGEVVLSAALGAIDNACATVRFSVRDTGIGIPSDKVGTLFNDFSQVDASTTRRYGGTGLGLAIVRRLVRLMGGEIAVTSEMGRGSEFSFTLRLPVATAPPVCHVAAAPVRLAGVRALVVDDNATNRRIVREILAETGAAISEASSAAGALAALDRALGEGLPYTLALLDSQMPDRDGWSLAADIRGHPALAKTHLLMLTSAGQPDDAEKCRELGIQGYVVKPVSRSGLVEATQSILVGDGKPAALVSHHALGETRARLRILLAEDNAVNQEVAAAMLRRRGHEVTVVDDGAKAVAAATKEPFDVVLMDIHMPEMDGLAATLAIRKIPGGARLPIIAVTADALAGEREHCLAAGMSGYLSKPFKSRELFAIVEGWGAQGETPGAGAVGRVVETPPADIADFRATMRQAGAEDAVDSILGTFISDAPRRSAALVAALTSGCAADIGSAAHVFKSASGAIGAHRLASLLLAVELAGKGGRIDDARACAEGVQDETNAVIAYLRGLRAGGEPTHA